MKFFLNSSKSLDKFLDYSRLAGTARDIAHLCGEGRSSNYYAMTGAMGGAVSIGLD